MIEVYMPFLWQSLCCIPSSAPSGSIYHVLLPGQASNWTVVVVLQVSSQLLALFVCLVASANSFNILQNCCVSPCPRDVVAQLIFMVNVNVLKPRKTISH